MGHEGNTKVMKNAMTYKTTTGKPQGRPRGTIKRRWENNIKMDLRDSV